MNTNNTASNITAASLIADPRRTAQEREEKGWRAKTRSWKIDALAYLASHPRKPSNKLTVYNPGSYKCWSVAVLTTHLHVRD